LVPSVRTNCTTARSISADLTSLGSSLPLVNAGPRLVPGHEGCTCAERERVSACTEGKGRRLRERVDPVRASGGASLTDTVRLLRTAGRGGASAHNWGRRWDEMLGAVGGAHLVRRAQLEGLVHLAAVRALHHDRLVVNVLALEQDPKKQA
jgi:hypothetical protein